MEMALFQNLKLLISFWSDFLIENINLLFKIYFKKIKIFSVVAKKEFINGKTKEGGGEEFAI
jgi:hypothetical protein